MITTSQEKLLDSLLSLPDAPILLNEANNRLIEESKKREQFYNDITESEKAEFINGEIIIHSPVKKEHNDVTLALVKLMSSYVDLHKLGYICYEKIMISLSRNAYEPDLCFFDKGKSEKFKKGQSLFPAPDLVVEVLSKGTAKNDRGVKFNDYQSHLVLEYWIVDPVNKIIEQYRLDKKGEFELILKSSNGTIESKAIKGFKISIESIFDKQKNLEELGKILNA